MCVHVYVCLTGMKNSGEGWGTREVHSSVAPSASHVNSSFLPGDGQVWSMCTRALGPTFNWNKSPTFKG